VARTTTRAEAAVQILYGVAGEGLGHAMRSQVAIAHLLARGHEVRVMASGRAHEVLAPQFADVHEIQGLRIAFRGQKVDALDTVRRNWRDLGAGLRHNMATWLGLTRAAPAQLAATGTDDGRVHVLARRMPFQPDVVVTDFESWTWLCARISGVPVVSLDNLQALNRCRQPKRLLKGMRKDFEVARTVVRAKVPGAAHYLVTSCFAVEPCKPRTSVVPPLLRARVLAARATRGDHVVVYRSTPGDDGLSEILWRLPQTEFRVYGVQPDLRADHRDENILYRPYDEATFVQDLASCRAVIAGGGFTLMTEALFLGKPMLVVPLEGHVEQTLNARWLDDSGLGLCSDRLRPRVVRYLLERADDLAYRLSRVRQFGNLETLAALDAQLQRLAG
jgi:uncharacterized protein (TIGR00661 family)